VRERLAGATAGGRLGAWLRRAAGALFVGLGLKLALTTR
jgi:threonine/homoserine/homoserine lactone efflux protein